MKIRLTLVVTSIAFLVFAVAAGNVRAVTIVVPKTDNLLQNMTNSAFFTNGLNGSPTVMAADGWAPIAPTQAGTTTSTTPKKTFSFTGDSTAAGSWLDGNGVPAGITLTFDAQFTISASPDGLLLTVPGTTATLFGQGIGTTGTVNGPNDINQGTGIQVSPVTVSNISFTGALSDPNYTFTPGGVGGFGTIVLRSSNYNNSNRGMVLTQGSDTIGFGQATGSILSNQQINNNFGPPGSPASSVFPRQSGPYTLIATQGVAVIKGIGLGFDVTYGITPIPPGDYNKNGSVDAADYVLWRKGDPAADSNGDTVVDQTDYEFWRANFGNPTGGGGSDAELSSSAVPEPASLTLLFVGMFAAGSWRMSRSRM